EGRVADDRRLVHALLLPDVVDLAIGLERADLFAGRTIRREASWLHGAPVIQDVKLDERVDGPAVDADVGQAFALLLLGLGEFGGEGAKLLVRLRLIEVEAGARQEVVVVAAT